MDLNPSACYRAVLARDSRHDGDFFTCVSTTGIYCRPGCPARPPKFDHCSFVPSAAAAEALGFRPCLRCRPECSPWTNAWRGTEASVSRALSLIEAGHLDRGSVGELAERVGLGERQLRRLFQQHVGATPLAVAQTRRLLLSRQLLRDTDLPVVQVAQASGFSSLRRFNEAFRAHYGSAPSDQRQARRRRTTPPGVQLQLRYRPPYDWDAMLGFLAARALPGVECVDAGRYRRVIRNGAEFGTLAVEHAPEQQALRVTVQVSQLSAVPELVSRVRRMFDLDADPQRIAQVLGADPMLARLVDARPGLRVPGGFDGYETAIRALLGQQVSVAAATRLAGRFVERFGQPLEGRSPGPLSHAFPQPAALDADAIAALGMPRARARAITAVSQAAALDPLLFDARADLATAVAKLRELPGIGEWTAQYIAMRALRERDAFLAGDVALQRICLGAQRGVPAQRALEAQAEVWRPFRAYAVVHLWTVDQATTQPSSPTREDS